MGTVSHKSWLDPTARALRAAIEAVGTSYAQLARDVGTTGSTLFNRVKARSPVDEAAARAMAGALQCDWQALVSPPNPSTGVVGPARKGGPRKALGRPKGGKNKPRAARAAPGPASRALALHQAAIPSKPIPAALTPFQPNPTLAPPVLAMEVRADGTASIVLRTVLPVDRAAAVFRQLLDMSLVAR